MANLIAQPRKWKKKAIVLKAESAYGTDAAPDGATNWFEARNISLKGFDAETVDRNIETDWFGGAGKLITSQWSGLSFEIALAGSGALGTAPKWGEMLLGCGFAETVDAGVSVAYNLVSEGVGSLTAYMVVDGILYKFVGTRGNLKVRLSAKGIPVLAVELTSLYTVPVAGTITGIDKTGWTYEQAVTSVNTGKVALGGVDLAFSTLELDMGNQISRIDLPGPQREVMIVDRALSGALTVLAPALSVFNPYALADAGTTLDLANTHGTVAGKKVKTAAKVRVVGITETEIEGMAAYQLGLDRVPVSGNDEFALTSL
jgi:hypothetical protein